MRCARRARFLADRGEAAVIGAMRRCRRRTGARWPRAWLFRFLLPERAGGMGGGPMTR